MIARRRAALAAVLAAAFAGAFAAAPAAGAAPDPAGCTPDVQLDPAIPTFKQVMDSASPPIRNDAIGGFHPGTRDRHITAQLYYYADALVQATASNPRVRIASFDLGPTTLGTFVGPRFDHGENGAEFKVYVIGTPEHIANLDNDASFWRGVRAGTISEDVALSQLPDHTAFGWVTETPHGDEPAGGEASLRLLYELAARTDCANLRRLQSLDVFIDPARNPDGRDNDVRTTAWGFDPNRDLMSTDQDINQAPLDFVFRNPGLFFIDAHQQSTGYFFPPNEDPVHHEISHFALNEIQSVIGPALQKRFNDQSLQYRNYNAYDMFTPEYGDTVPSLILGSAGMTYEKGASEVYGKQVYDHYLAMDETLNVVSNHISDLKRGWVGQWTEATQQGQGCGLQQNVLVSPLHTKIEQQPDIPICGYFFRAGNHSGDVAHIVALLQARGVHIYRLDSSVTVSGVKEFGNGVRADGPTTTETLPAGTLWVPASQTMKHWIHATLEENPFIPYKYFYDVVDWSFPEVYDQGGNGELEQPLPAGTPMTEVTGDPGLGTAPTSPQPVYAFNTDSLQALGMVIDLLNDGATVSRAKTPFVAGGVRFESGAALVDGGTIGLDRLSADAERRETPVFGLSVYPVDRYPLAKPKIALYTGSDSVPTNPLDPGAGTGQCLATSFCEAYFALTQQARIPTSQVVPVTATQLSRGALERRGFTALVDANSEVAAAGGSNSPATALRRFVNRGGNFVTYGSNGLTSARNAGMTNVDTSPTDVPPWTSGHCANFATEHGPGALTSPGTSFSASFETADPIAWGFDQGGYIYRNSSSTFSNPVFDPASLHGSGPIPDPTAAASYPDRLVAYGYTCNTLDPGELPGRPYAIDQPFGTGHNALLGSDVFFRGWEAGGAVRMAMNGILFPTGAALPPSASGKAAASRARAAHRPIPRDRLPEIKSRPAVHSHDIYRDVRLTVNRSQGAALARIVRRARPPRHARAELRYRRSGGRLTLIIPNAYREAEQRPLWQWRIIKGLVAHHITPRERQI